MSAIQPDPMKPLSTSTDRPHAPPTDEEADTPENATTNVVDFMALLQKSLASKKRTPAQKHAAKSTRKSDTKKKSVAKKPAAKKASATKTARKRAPARKAS